VLLDRLVLVCMLPPTFPVDATFRDGPDRLSPSRPCVRTPGRTPVPKAALPIIGPHAANPNSPHDGMPLSHPRLHITGSLTQSSHRRKPCHASGPKSSARRQSGQIFRVPHRVPHTECAIKSHNLDPTATLNHISLAKPVSGIRVRKTVSPVRTLPPLRCRLDR